MNKWTKIPSNEQINKTVKSLNQNGINTFIAENAEEAKKKFFELVPHGSEVFTNSSTTLNTLGITETINKSGEFVSLINKVSKMPTTTPREAREKKAVGATPEYAVGSAHAITHDGKILIASGSGSQIPGYAYGTDRIVLIVSANKIVKDIDEGLQRIYEYILPLESERVNKAYNITSGSSPRRIIIINSENEDNKNRTNVIIVKEVLGF